MGKQARPGEARAEQITSVPAPSLDELDPLVTLQLHPSLQKALESKERERACRKLQDESHEDGPRKGGAQSFTLRYSVLREYVYYGQYASPNMSSSLRYMRLYLLLLSGPRDLVANYLADGTFRSKHDFRPMLISAFALMIQHAHSRSSAAQASAEPSARAVAALHALCFTKLGRQRNNFVWLRWRQRIAPFSGPISLLIVLVAIQLGKYVQYLASL